jgi:hypothetical protein
LRYKRRQAWRVTHNNPPEERGMLSTPENSHVMQEGLAERLRAFMLLHQLSLEDLSYLLRTPRHTIKDWFEGGDTPPACVLGLMVLLQTQSPVVQNAAAMGHGRSPGTGSLPASRESMFDEGHEQALKRVRAI